MKQLEYRSYRCDITLWHEDVEYLREHLGWGWTRKIRELTHEWVEQLKEESRELSERS